MPRKASLLFGKRASLFTPVGEEQFEKHVLEAAIKGLAQLRHAAFHFKGLGEFASALTVRRATEDVAVERAFQQLWLVDWAERSERILAAMRGAWFDWLYEDQYGPPSKGLPHGRGRCDPPAAICEGP